MTTVPSSFDADIPTVSLIMTVRDCREYLDIALASVLEQSFDDWELILWDDGSTDGSSEIARRFADLDSRIRLFTSEPIGRRPALTHAHSEARGEFVGWIDADDKLAPPALERLVAFLRETPACGLVYSDHLVIEANGEIRGPGHRTHIPYSAHRLLLTFMTFHFRLIRRTVFEQAGGINPSFDIAIDYDLCLRISELTQIRRIAEPLYYYREHYKQMSSRSRTLQAAASATAIRDAIDRRGLSDVYKLRVNLESFRFRLEDRLPAEESGALSPVNWVRIALATAFTRLRPLSRQVPKPRMLGYWPAREENVHVQQLHDAARIRGVHARSLGEDLPSLLRAVWTGRAGDMLNIHSFNLLLEMVDRGSVMANYFLFVKTLDHARARGMSIVWSVDEVMDCGGKHADLMLRFRKALAARCQAVIVHSEPARAQLEQELGGAIASAVVARHPHRIDVFPDVSEAHARSRLELTDRRGATFLFMGTVHDAGGVARLVDAIETVGQLKEARVLVAGRLATPDVERDLAKLAARSDALQIDPEDVEFGKVPAYYRVADVVVLSGENGFRWSDLATAMSMQKPILAPATPAVVEALPGENFLYQDSCADSDQSFLRTVERLCLADDEWSRIGEQNLERCRAWDPEEGAEALSRIV